MIWNEEERWVGRGADDEEAFFDAVRQMLPSRFARSLLEQRGVAADLAPKSRATFEPAAWSAVSPGKSEPTSLPADDPSFDESAVRLSTRSLALDPKTVPAADPQPPEPTARPSSSDGEAPLAALPTMPSTSGSGAPPLHRLKDALSFAPAEMRGVSDVSRVTTPYETRPAIPPSGRVRAPDTAVTEAPPRDAAAEQAAVDAALEGIERLYKETVDQEPRFALLAPDRQRLQLLLWMSRGRTFEERLSFRGEVTRAVGRVAKRLTDLAKTYWPGSVRALKLEARPGDAGIARRPGEAPPRTWAEATEFVERAFVEQLASAAAAGLDEDGWADRAQLRPPPRAAKSLLDETAQEIERLTPAPGSVGGELDVAALIPSARALRWLRGSDCDPQKWGITMGRLRSAVGPNGPQELRDLCEPRYRPSRAWAWLVGAARTELGEAPDESAPKGTVIAWILRAFDVLDTPAIAELVQPHREALMATDERELPTPDRRVRRRFRELVRRLGNHGDTERPAADSLDAPTETELDTLDMPASASSLDLLLQALRQHTNGRSALFVTNREDPQLKARLEELLGFELSWCDGSPRRVQAQCERIASKRFDLVLCATGFQNHSVDAALAKAAKGADVPLVRVDRGRPLACVRAIAREFGVREGIG